MLQTLLRYPGQPSGLVSFAVAAHLVHCIGCQKPYDAIRAGWCSCVAPDRTLSCPHCQACFCPAPSSFRQAFWIAAPRPLWARKQRDQETRHLSNPWSVL